MSNDWWRESQVIKRAVTELREAEDAVRLRGEPCGLLANADPSTGYDDEPKEFLAFVAMGVDGVHDGLWVDDPAQDYEPFVVMFSPMDSESIVPLAPTAGEWIERQRVAARGSVDWEAYIAAENERRAALGLQAFEALLDQ